MGSLPKIKRRCLGTSVVSLAAILSAVILYLLLFSRPAYLERLPDVLLPSYETESSHSSNFEDTTEKGAKLDGSDKAVHTTTTSSSSSSSSSSTTKAASTTSSEQLSTTVASTSTTKATAAAPTKSSSKSSSWFSLGWKFDPSRDSTAYILDSEQCQSAFPGLFAEIERGVASRKELGNITAEDLDISPRGNGAVHALILDQQVCATILPFTSSAHLTLPGSSISCKRRSYTTNTTPRGHWRFYMPSTEP